MTKFDIAVLKIIKSVYFYENIAIDINLILFLFFKMFSKSSGLGGNFGPNGYYDSGKNKIKREHEGKKGIYVLEINIGYLEDVPVILGFSGDTFTYKRMIEENGAVFYLTLSAANSKLKTVSVS